MSGAKDAMKLLVNGWNGVDDVRKQLESDGYYTVVVGGYQEQFFDLVCLPITGTGLKLVFVGYTKVSKHKIKVMVRYCKTIDLDFEFRIYVCEKERKPVLQFSRFFSR